MPNTISVGGGAGLCPAQWQAALNQREHSEGALHSECDPVRSLLDVAISHPDPCSHMTQDCVFQKENYSNGPSPGGAIWTESSTPPHRRGLAPLAPLRDRARLTEAPLQARAGRTSRGDRGPAFAAAGCRLQLAKDGDSLNMQGRVRARAACCARARVPRSGDRRMVSRSYRLLTAVSRRS